MHKSEVTECIPELRCKSAALITQDTRAAICEQASPSLVKCNNQATSKLLSTYPAMHLYNPSKKPNYSNRTVTEVVYV